MYINILALEMASQENRHCAKCIGTLSFPLVLATTTRVPVLLPAIRVPG